MDANIKTLLPAIASALVAVAIAFGVYVASDEPGSPPVDDPPVALEPPKPEPSPALLMAADFKYLGGFRLPAWQNDLTAFEYGASGIAFCPERNTLFVTGHVYHSRIAEVSIPAPVVADAADALPRATAVQPQTEWRSRLPQPDPGVGGSTSLGGLYYEAGKLYGTILVYYDASGGAQRSHFVLDEPSKLATSPVRGLYRVGSVNPGFTAGYIGAIPVEQRERLGKKHYTGQYNLPIISRTSSGPAAFGFDLADLGNQTAEAVELLSYPLDHPLSQLDSQNDLFNFLSAPGGAAWIGNSLLFFGRHGTGPYWYGEWYAGPDGSGTLAQPHAGADRIQSSKGPHAPPYIHRVWAYDAREFLRGQPPYTLRPYSYWTPAIPFGGQLAGVAFDAARRRVFVAAAQALDGGSPVVHVFQVR